MSAIKFEQSASVTGARKRILFVSGFVVDTYSEIERSYIELCASVDFDFEFLWLVPEVSFKHNRFARPENRTALKEPVWLPHLREHAIPYVVGNISKCNLIANFLLFREIFRDPSIDAVYTHFGFERFWAAFFGKLWGKTVIWNEHWHSLGRRYAMVKRIFYRIFVDEFVSVSRFITSTLPANSRVHTVPNSIRISSPLSKNQKRATKTRRELAINEDQCVVLMVAAFRPEKRHPLALEICRRVINERSDVFFVFLGEGALRGDFLEKVENEGLSDRVTAPGHVDNVDDYYAIADVCMLTSHCEPFGYVVLEAMRHGLPVVAFDSGGPMEVIRTGETGILVKDADVAQFARKLLELIGNKGVRARIGERARNVAQLEFSRDAWIERLNKLLRDIAVSGRDLSAGRS